VHPKHIASYIFQETMCCCIG